MRWSKCKKNEGEEFLMLMAVLWKRPCFSEKYLNRLLDLNTILEKRNSLVTNGRVAVRR